MAVKLSYRMVVLKISKIFIVEFVVGKVKCLQFAIIFKKRNSVTDIFFGIFRNFQNNCFSQHLQTSASGVSVAEISYNVSLT